jgi:hypothetical protein
MRQEMKRKEKKKPDGMHILEVSLIPKRGISIT